MDKFRLKTPCYSIDYDELEYNFDSMKSAFIKNWGENFEIGYSVKTNNLPWVLDYMLKKKAKAEVVSSFEYDLAREIGFKCDEIIYNGPFKDYNSLKYALENKSIVNIDSLVSLKKIGKMKLEDVEIIIRINFDFESICPEEVDLGTWSSRFGISLEDGSFKKALEFCEHHNIKVVGLHIHQGLKKRSVKAFNVIAKTIADTILNYNLTGIKYVDVGGGFFGGRGFVEMPTFDEYAKAISKELKRAVDEKEVMLLVEPGVSLISSPISYFTTVEVVKNIRNHRIVIVDGSSLHTNPFFIDRTPDYTLYAKDDVYEGLQLVSGSTCLENDRFFEIKDGKELKRGNIVEIKRCGGYTVSLNNFFISPPPHVYLKKNDKYREIRKTWGAKKLL